jgi:hypothetical protein
MQKVSLPCLKKDSVRPQCNLINTLFFLSFGAVGAGFREAEVGADGGVGLLSVRVGGIGSQQDLVAAVVDRIVDCHRGQAALLA